MGKWEEERQTLCRVCHKLARTGLVAGYSGNASMRLKSPEGDLMLITPMGGNLEGLAPNELAVVDLEGEPVEEDLPPSSESALHLTAYHRRPDVGGVVHTHPVFATAVAVAAEEIPPIIDEVVIKIGGRVKVAEYAFPGTEELAKKALDALEDRMAVLLRNHGLMTVGPSVEEALDNSLAVERLAQVFLYASLLKEVKPLPPEIIKMEEELYQMRQAVEKASGGPYGIGT